MNFIEKIAEELEKKNVVDFARQEIIDQKIKDKTSEDIASYLVNLKPTETGGITAISGFYYQFLITLKYIIEMLEGEWDFVIMEHHDDIVVGKDKKIRYVQVKTSEKVNVRVTTSPARGLYSRSPKNIDGKKFEKFDSWIDKLLLNSNITPKSSGFTTEFELYTSYHLLKADSLDIDIYTGKDSFNKTISSSDELLEKVKGEVFFEESIIKTDDIFEEDLTDLLSRFRIKTDISLDQIQYIKDSLLVQLSKWVFKDTGSSFTLTDYDLNMIIGYLCEKCTYKGNAKVLLINKEIIESILTDVRRKRLLIANEEIIANSSLRIVEEVVTEIAQDLNDSKYSISLKEELYSYKAYIDKWIREEKGDVQELLERYIAGTTKTDVYSNLGTSARNRKLKDFLTIVMLLNLAKDTNFYFKDTKGMILKECIDKEESFSFLNLDKQKDLSYAKKKLVEIMTNSDMNSQLESLGTEFNIVLQNYVDRGFLNLLKWDLKEESIQKVEGLEQKSTLKDVPLILNLYPGSLMMDDFIILRNTDEDIDLKEDIKKIWTF